MFQARTHAMLLYNKYQAGMITCDNFIRMEPIIIAMSDQGKERVIITIKVNQRPNANRNLNSYLNPSPKHLGQPRGALSYQPHKYQCENNLSENRLSHRTAFSLFCISEDAFRTEKRSKVNQIAIQIEPR